MKSIKMLGLAVMAALMAMAFVGAGSAMAEGSTALCKADESPCSAGNIITHVHETTLAGNPELLLSSLVEIKCDVLFLGDALNSGVAPLLIHGHYTYTNCKTASGSSCTVTEKSTDSLVSILRLGSELADVTYQYEFNFHCGFFINCTYDGENLVGHGLGALTASEENGQTRIEEAVTHKTGGSLCPETVHLDQLITPLEKAYLVTREEESLKMVCLKVSNENTGLYNSSGNGQTCESDNAERVGNYELALVLPSLGTGQMACGEVEHSGFLLSFGGGKECQTKDLERKGLYELGVIQ